MLCQHCKKEFSDIYKLQRHQKTAKFCLILQNKEKDTRTCSGCSKTFFSERELSAHSCRFVLSQNNETIQQLREELENLKARVKYLEEDRKSLNSTKASKLNALLPLTEDLFQDAVSDFTLEDILKGAYGYATLALNRIFKGRVYCSDISRHKVMYKDEQGDIKPDNDMMFLRVRFFSAINERNKELINEYKTGMKAKLKDEEWDDSENEEDFFTETIKLLDYKPLVSEASQGKTNDFVTSFISCVCSELVRTQ